MLHQQNSQIPTAQGWAPLHKGNYQECRCRISGDSHFHRSHLDPTVPDHHSHYFNYFPESPCIPGHRQNRTGRDPVRDSNKHPGVSWHEKSERLEGTQSAKIPPHSGLRQWGVAQRAESVNPQLHSHIHTGTAELDPGVSQENGSLNEVMGTGSCHPWNTPGPIKTSVCSSLLLSSTRISTGKPHNVVFADNKSNFIFGCSPQKGSADMQKGVLGSKTQAWLHSDNPISNFQKPQNKVLQWQCLCWAAKSKQWTELVDQRDTRQNVSAALHFHYHCKVNKVLLPFYQSIKLCVGIALEFSNRPENKLFFGFLPVQCEAHLSERPSYNTLMKYLL